MGIISSYLHEPFIYIFFLRCLLVRVVFSMHHFQIWTFQSRFPKRMWFLSRFKRFLSTFRLNLLKNHVPFEHLAREGGFLKALFSNQAFQSPFPKRMRFLSRFRLNLLKNHVPFDNSAREGGFLISPFSNLTFQSRFPQKNAALEEIKPKSI